MEHLLRIVAAVFLVGFACLLGGFWMLHSAINAGDIYQGIIGLIMGVVGLFATGAVVTAASS